VYITLSFISSQQFVTQIQHRSCFYLYKGCFFSFFFDLAVIADIEEELIGWIGGKLSENKLKAK